MFTSFKTLSVVTLAMVLVTSEAFAGQSPRKNLEIFNDVSDQVTRYSYFTVFDAVNAGIENGVVTLTGRVTMPFKRSEIEKRVARVAGVQKVVNQIEVLPVSQNDDELRYRIARAIYGNSSFWQYASMSNPPIHIIVERGHVTLTGVVTSSVDRMLARSLASTAFGAFSVKNELQTDAEAKQALERL